MFHSDYLLVDPVCCFINIMYNDGDVDEYRKEIDPNDEQLLSYNNEELYEHMVEMADWHWEDILGGFHDDIWNKILPDGSSYDTSRSYEIGINNVVKLYEDYDFAIVYGVYDYNTYTSMPIGLLPLKNEDDLCESEGILDYQDFIDHKELENNEESEELYNEYEIEFKDKCVKEYQNLYKKVSDKFMEVMKEHFECRVRTSSWTTCKIN